MLQRLQDDVFLLLHLVLLGMPVYVFHDVVGFPSAELQYVRVRDAERVRVAREVVPELVLGEVFHSRHFLESIQLLRQSAWVTFVYGALRADHAGQIIRQRYLPI